MKVFKLSSPDGFEWLLPINDSDIELLRWDGTPRAAAWKPVRMERLKVWETGEPLVFSDFPSCGGGMRIVSQAAKKKIGFCLEQYGELLPLTCEEGDFWAFNATRLVDALDEKRSTFLRASDTGEIIMVKKPVLRAEAIGSNHVFKLSQDPRGPMYVTDAFVELVTPLRLRGLSFKQVWSSD